ncbi:hypothetical protein PG911_08785 [Tenacibaculum ovolyticum]|nr:hypothetical protein [Tenacibaculum ovolyticum]WBX78341.1 hypothetical protein PG911_08785 [Tenacibaculum ovolyticum]
MEIEISQIVLAHKGVEIATYRPLENENVNEFIERVTPEIENELLK